MKLGVLSFRMCHMHRLILDILVNNLMLRIVFLHVHRGVEERKWFVINRLFVVGDIGPVVFRFVMLREASSYIKVHFGLHSCFAK